MRSVSRRAPGKKPRASIDSEKWRGRPSSWSPPAGAATPALFSASSVSRSRRRGKLQPGAAPWATAARRRSDSRALFLAEAFAALQVGVTDGAVHVDRALFEALEQVQVERSLVDDVAHLHTHAVPDERQEIGERFHQTVDRLADPLTDRQRLQER